MRGFLRAAGVLTVGRQAGALVLTAAVLLLPERMGAAEVDMFLWAYFAQLIVSSILNLGLERLTARSVGVSPGEAAATLASVLRYRLLSAPLTAVALYGVFLLVGIDLPATAYAAVVCWTLVVQVQGVLFSAIRSRGDVAAEAAIVFVSRVVQTAVLLVVAGTVARADALLASLAVVDALALAAAWRWLPPQGQRGITASDRRLLATYTLIEVVAFAYLRADLLIAGRMLGEHEGATYGLAYRVLDGMAAMLSPTLLVLFPTVAGLAAAGVDLRPLQRRLVAVVAVGTALAAAAILLVPVAVAASERFGDAAAALRILLASVPLTFAVAIEVHVASASGDNAKVTWSGGGVLVGNIVANLLVIPRFGIVGAATVLWASEAAYAFALSRLGIVKSHLPLIALIPSVALLAGAASSNRGAPMPGSAICLAVLAVAGAAAWAGARSPQRAGV